RCSCVFGGVLCPAGFFVIFLSVLFLSFPACSWLKKFARLADSLRHSSTNRRCGFEQEATEKPERDWRNHGWQNHLGIEQQRREDAKRRAETEPNRDAEKERQRREDCGEETSQKEDRKIIERKIALRSLRDNR